MSQVFSDYHTATQYRKALDLPGKSCTNIITLDGKRLASNGVLDNDSFKPVPLALTFYRFATGPIPSES